MGLLQWLIDVLIPQPPEGYQFCMACYGTGHAQGTTAAYWFSCPECQGTGLVKA